MARVSTPALEQAAHNAGRARSGGLFARSAPMLATHIPSAALVLRTKLTPPRPHRQVLPRPALHARIREALD
jgi:hypothetical protein